MKAYTDGQLLDIFNRFDTNRSGTIDFRELRNLLAASGEYPSDARALQLVIIYRNK
jgi:Ca2+-binding EF-hand superfamily protein